MKRHLLGIACATLLFSVPAWADGSVKFSVNGMVCAFCAQGIEKRLTRMPETGPLYINLAQKVVAVQAKAGKTIDVAKVRAEITDAGYDVTAVQAVPQTVAEIRAEMRGRK